MKKKKKKIHARAGHYFQIDCQMMNEIKFPPSIEMVECAVTLCDVLFAHFTIYQFWKKNKTE